MGDGRERDMRDMNARKGTTGRRVMAAVLCGLAIVTPLGLAGCSGNSLSDISQALGGAPLGNDEKTTRTVQTEDKQYTEVVSDGQGHSALNVIKVTQKDDSTAFDAGAFQSKLSENQLDYYQFIYGKSNGSKQNPECYLYMPKGSSYQTVEAAKNLVIAAGYNASLMSQVDYDAYLNRGPDIYYVETTVFGPAAQAEVNQNQQ